MQDATARKTKKASRRIKILITVTKEDTRTTTTLDLEVKGTKGCWKRLKGMWIVSKIFPEKRDSKEFLKICSRESVMRWCRISRRANRLSVPLKSALRTAKWWLSTSEKPSDLSLETLCKATTCRMTTGSGESSISHRQMLSTTTLLTRAQIWLSLTGQLSIAEY